MTVAVMPPSAALPAPPRAKPRPATSLLVIVAVGLALYLPGINWGLPGTVSWSQDTIAGARTLGAMEGWPNDWKGRYPPLHYMILYAAYQPVLWHWSNIGARSVDPATGRMELHPPHAPKVGALLLIAGAVSATMAVAAGIGLWAATREWTGDALAALIAAIAFMIGADFTYFAHLGNVDVPSVCWFTWSLFFYVRALRSRSWMDAALLGLFGSLAMSTKDAAAGAYPGMAVVLLMTEILEPRPPVVSLARRIVGAVFQWRWLPALAAFVIPYLWVNGVFANPQGYVERMAYWLIPPADTLHARQFRYADQFRLGLATLHYAASAVGWPMLAALLASTVYAMRRHTRTAVVVLAPALSYYAVVIAQIDFVYARFLFVPLALLYVLVGLAGAGLLRTARLMPIVRLAIVTVVLVPSLAYAVAVDLELMTDSRYEAEAWFAANVPPPSSIGAFTRDEHLRLTPQYLPRVHDMGYATYPLAPSRESFDRPQPEYLIVSSYDYEDFDTSQRACVDDLLAGRLGYEPVATFRGGYLAVGSSWLGVAGWGTPTLGKISPTLTVLHRAGP